MRRSPKKDGTLAEPDKRDPELLRRMPREEAVAEVMREHNVDEVRAQFILQLKLGETTGDAFITRPDP